MKVIEKPEIKRIIIELEEDLLDCFINDKVNEQVKFKIEKGFTEFIIDFTKVRYVKSTGIGVLIRAQANITGINGRLILVHINEKIAGLLELTNLDEIFEIKDSIKELN